MLETLDLSDNNLEGCIPDGIGKLTSLKRLYLYKNKLTGDSSALICPLNDSFD
jgi:Leucine-rich repeat (LRR) protein